MAKVKICIGNIKGKDGITPHIGDNGHWYIGDEDTNVVAGTSANEFTKEQLISLYNVAKSEVDR